MMKKYDAYKDSGVEWIGEVPKHWEIKKLKYLAAINPSKSVFYREREEDEEVIFLPMEKVLENGQFIQDQRKPIREVKSGFTYFERDDIIIAKITPCFENGKIALLEQLSTNFGFGSTEFHVLRAKDRIQKVYLYYLLQSHIFKTLGEAFMVGAAGQKRVPTDFVTEFIIALPLFSEQTAIAAYLDRSTAEIDALIADKKRLIELLEEEKAAIINQAVTKGLDPDAPMKDSGVEWLGEVPEGWEVKKIGHCASIVRGGSPRPAGDPRYFLGNFIPWITVKEVTNAVSKYVESTEEYLTEEGSKLSRIIQPETLLLSNSGATLGVPKISKIKGCINDGSVAFISFRDFLFRDFLYYFFISHTQIYREEMKGNGQPNLNTEIIKSTFFPVPPVEEQKLIVKNIEAECARIDIQKSETRKLIDLLTEYRTALISEVVTGKIKVTE